MKRVLRRLRDGELTEAEAEAELRRLELVELGGRARLDLGRQGRRGLPEVVLASRKSPEDTARLLLALAAEAGQGLASRLSAGHWESLERALATGAGGCRLLRYGDAARLLRPGFEPEPRPGRVAVLTAGTSDGGPAEEVRMVVESAGLKVRLEADLGVAGLHRLWAPLTEVLDWGADVLVVAAGMDGVLPGVVAGLIDRPVIGLPVSVGYGAGGAGEAALLTMLQSCSTGLVVVNVDNGVGAGAAAVLIAGRAHAGAADPAAPRPPPGPARRRSAGPARPESPAPTSG